MSKKDKEEKKVKKERLARKKKKALKKAKEEKKAKKAKKKKAEKKKVKKNKDKKKLSKKSKLDTQAWPLHRRLFPSRHAPMPIAGRARCPGCTPLPDVARTTPEDAQERPPAT